MANYTVTAPGFALHNTTLAASAEDTVTFPAKIETAPELFIWPSSSTTPVYFTVDGTAATVGGSNCYIVFPGTTAMPIIPPTTQYARATVVRLISAATCTYSITEG